MKVKVKGYDLAMPPAIPWSIGWSIGWSIACANGWSIASAILFCLFYTLPPDLCAFSSLDFSV